MCDNTCGAFFHAQNLFPPAASQGDLRVLKEDQRVSEFRSSKKFG